jgi:Mg2+-importing ATPase
MGPVSSLFDFITFFVLLQFFRAGESLFQTAWFVESIATQVLVVFIIRTRRAFIASRPHPALVTLAIGVVSVAAALPYIGISAAFGFVPLPLPICVAIACIVVLYLLTMEAAKHGLRRIYLRA